MSTSTLERPKPSPAGAVVSPALYSAGTEPLDPSEKRTMYAIAFDMDTETLKASYGSDSYNNAYSDIRKVLEEYHFTRQQGSVYFGDPKKVNAVSCVLAVMALTRRHAWFGPSVRDIRMLRIEEQNDLMTAVRDAVAQQG